MLKALGMLAMLMVGSWLRPEDLRRPTADLDVGDAARPDPEGGPPFSKAAGCLIFLALWMILALLLFSAPNML